MLRILFAATLPLTLPAAGAADGMSLRSVLSVDGPAEARPDPVARARVEGELGDFYGGFLAATVPQPDRAGDLDVFLGLRPSIGPASVDLSYTRRVDDAGGDIALDVARPVARRASVGARVVLDTDEAVARTEARAEIRPLRDTTIGGTLAAGGLGREPTLSMDVRATRTFAEGLHVRLRQLFASYAAERTELSLSMDF